MGSTYRRFQVKVGFWAEPVNWYLMPDGSTNVLWRPQVPVPKEKRIFVAAGEHIEACLETENGLFQFSYVRPGGSLHSWMSDETALKEFCFPIEEAPPQEPQVEFLGIHFDKDKVELALSPVSSTDRTLARYGILNSLAKAELLKKGKTPGLEELEWRMASLEIAGRLGWDEF